MTLSPETAAGLETELFATAAERPNKVTGGPIFILGAPRTGSTISYQALVAAYGLPYLANLTNQHFAEHPIIGLWLQAGVPIFDRISGQSQFGKVEGAWQPSEASAVMAAWLGSGHPSEVVSARALPEREAHFRRTIDATHRLFGRPLVIKNAWNCFRLPYLRAALPEATFIWIRRDLAASACSDLRARYVVQGDPNAWNSATPRNWGALRARPYWEQVVENQAEFSRAIAEGLVGLPPERWAEIWHEDLCANPEGSLGTLGSTLTALLDLPFVPARIPAIAQEPSEDALDARDSRAIEDYIAANVARFERLRHPSCRSRPKHQRRARA